MRRAAFRWIGWALAAWIAAAPLASACHPLTPAQNPGMGDWEDNLSFFVERSGSTTFLGPSESSGDQSEAILFDASGAATMNAQAPTGAGRQVTNVVSASLSQSYFLNLSKPVVGRLYWRSSTGQSTGHDATAFRFELFLGTVRIGGDECSYGATAALGGWNPVVVRFRPEVAVLDAGSAVTLRVTRQSGMGDFQVGTGGDHQSLFEFRVFHTDPLGGALYLQDHRMTVGEAASPPEGRAVGSAWVWLALAPLAALRRGAHGPRMAMLLGAALLLGGCLGAGRGAPAETSDVPDGPRSTLQGNQTDVETLRESGHGAIEGFVRDQYRIPVEGAHVLLVGTSSSARSGAQGFFAMPNVTGGAYTMRFDREGFASLEERVRVENGKLLRLNVTLAREEKGPAGARTHQHDDWGGEVKRSLWQSSVVPNSYVGSPITNYQGLWFCYYAAANCDTEIPIKADQPVLPGTRMVEVRLRWDPLVYGVKELGLRIQTGKNASAEQRFVFRGPDEPFRIPIFPDEADPGHQRFTSWVVFLVVPQHNLYEPFAPLVSAGRVSVQMESTMYKGVIPLEPPHRDLWGGQSEFVLFQDEKRTAPCTTPCDFPYTLGGASGYWKVANAFVPPGTLEVRGTLRWESANTAGTQWYVSYKGANSPSAKPQIRPAQQQTPGTMKTDFVIRPEANEFDQYYQAASNWILFQDDRADAVPTTYYSANTGVGTIWYLSAKAIRDPEWKPD